MPVYINNTVHSLTSTQASDWIANNAEREREERDRETERQRGRETERQRRDQSQVKQFQAEGTRWRCAFKDSLLLAQSIHAEETSQKRRAA